MNDNGVFSLIDLKSLNGTIVNERAIREHQLEHGDLVVIGRCRFVFRTSPDGVLLERCLEKPDILSDERRSRSIEIAARILDEERTLVSSRGQALKGVFVDKLSRSMEALHSLAELVGSEIDPHELLKSAAEMLLDCFHAERACILVENRATKELIPAAYAFRENAGAKDLALSESIIDAVAREGASLLCKDAISDDRFEAQASVEELQLRSVMCTPLRIRDQLLGLAYLDSRAAPGEFGNGDLRLLKAIVNQLALVFDSVNLLSKARVEVQRLQEEVESIQGPFIGDCRATQRPLRTARMAADSNATVLLLGESGTGKEVLSRCIHRWSQRYEGPFVVVNCAALSEPLLESELFGHEKGAFTGAVMLKRGKLESAAGGTIFLDEIGELRPELQARLLRFLECREFERVGGIRPIKVDLRVLAATNRNLAEEVRTGRFREDLYFRLKVIEIEIPPLRKRRADIALLARHFLEHFAGEANKRISGFSDQTVAFLKEHPWRGNVRELRNAIERAVILCEGNQIEVRDLGLELEEPQLNLSGVGCGYHDQVKMLKRKIIEDALDKCEGVQSTAADELGIQRSYLSRLMKNLGMR